MFYCPYQSNMTNLITPTCTYTCTYQDKVILHNCPTETKTQGNYYPEAWLIPNLREDQVIHKFENHIWQEVFMYEAGKNKKRAVTLGNLVQRTDCPAFSIGCTFGCHCLPWWSIQRWKGSEREEKNGREQGRGKMSAALKRRCVHTSCECIFAFILW